MNVPLYLIGRPHVKHGAEAYGYGAIVQTRNGVTSYGHGGSAPGTQFEFRIYPEL